MRAAVIGSPISHSLSPAIFKFIGHEEKKDITYQAIEVMPTELRNFLRSKEYVGLNVTLPLKEIATSLMDHVSPEVRAIGALNVIHFKEGRRLGHNTDVVGIAKSMESHSIHVGGENCLIWGAGGAARAMAYVLGKERAATVIIYNRSDRGQDLVKHFSSLFPQTVFKAISGLDEISDLVISLMVNTTPVGMTGKKPEKDFFKAASGLKFSSRAWAFDLIYTPESTDFLKVGQTLGLQTLGGMDMLISQALETWRIWFGHLLHEEKLHLKLKTFLNGILRLRSDDSPLYLTGFMGAGKSTVGSLLAQITGREFIDTDREIEAWASQSIPDIFKTMGESVFREFETKILSENVIKHHTVIALGGGALIKDVNRRMLSSKGVMIYLEADAHHLEERVRLQGNNRPLLEGLDQAKRQEKISSLLNERRPLYEKAQVIIDTSNRSPWDVCYEIISKLGEIQ